jgi:phytoene dehydrogenase-like protein
MHDATSADVIVIGAGHNGLVCAAYLAKAGLSVRVLEARDCIGGAALTEEFHPGFRNSVYSYSVSLLHPKVIADLRLEEHGLEIMERPAGSLSLLEDGHLQLTRDGEQARREIARFSRATPNASTPSRTRSACGDGAAQPGHAGAAELRRRLARPPHAPAAGGNQLRKLDSKHQIVLTELMTRSLGDHLDAWFEGDPSRGCWASRA